MALFRVPINALFLYSIAKRIMSATEQKYEIEAMKNPSLSVQTMLWVRSAELPRRRIKMSHD